VSWQLKQFGNDVSGWVNDSIAVPDRRSSPPVIDFGLSWPLGDDLRIERDC
jgi:hypothetical protein